MTTPPPYPGQAPAPWPANPPTGSGVAAPPPARRPARVWDVVLTIVLLAAAGALAAGASVMGMFLVMASDPCGARSCSNELIMIGWLMGMILPWVAFIVTAIVAIIRMVKRRLAFWVPLVGAAAIALSLVLAFMVTAAGVPGSSV